MTPVPENVAPQVDLGAFRGQVWETSVGKILKLQVKGVENRRKRLHCEI